MDLSTNRGSLVPFAKSCMRTKDAVGPYLSIVDFPVEKARTTQHSGCIGKTGKAR